MEAPGGKQLETDRCMGTRGYQRCLISTLFLVDIGSCNRTDYSYSKSQSGGTGEGRQRLLLLPALSLAPSGAPPKSSSVPDQSARFPLNRRPRHP